MGPKRLVFEMDRRGHGTVTRSTVYRVLVRNGLIEPRSRRRRRQRVVRHLRIKTKDGIVADALLREFRRPGSADHKWVVADALAFACDKRHFAELTELAADKSHGHGRAPLVEMQWRVKTAAADRVLLDGIGEPDVTFAAMSALRRRLEQRHGTPAHPAAAQPR